MKLNLIKEKGLFKSPILYVMLILIASHLATIFSGVFSVFYERMFFSVFPSNSYMSTLAELSGFIALTLSVIFLSRVIYKQPLHGLGFTKKSSLRDYLKGWLYGASILTICVIIMMIFGAVKINRVEFNARLALQFIPLIIAWSIQGNAEEVLTRGFILAGVSQRINILTGIVISSAFFSVMHLGNNGLDMLPLIDLFMFGIFASLVMIKSKNIWVVSGFHAAWNCFQGNVFAFPVSGTSVGNAFFHVTTHGPNWLSGGKFGVEGSMVSILVQLILIAWLYYDIFIKGKRKLTDKFDF
ncbi:CPBP family intramembrane glutamic endopeptidase [Peptostreptococcus sp. D1]|uniref:CPBP family intramembrane glutamic endopeptidase n=1 Tax=Peptostreptococcus sp. D1 TaxID=72304 RepID=UPI0008EEDB6E|nr:type II CAAX endopeptidase family protein [Peptostreptococcus sp. D1]SFE54677.1 hypothetical protein SAMN02910278_01102 [Peptostreptococcus sp. D1]